MLAPECSLFHKPDCEHKLLGDTFVSTIEYRADSEELCFLCSTGGFPHIPKLFSVSEDILYIHILCGSIAEVT